VEFDGMDWSCAHTPVTEVRAMSWVPKEVLFDELDDETFQDL